MKHFALILLFAISSLTIAQEMDSILVQKDSVIVEKQTQPETQPTSPQASKWYYGGTVGFNFWSDYFYLSLNPLVGYQVSPKFSVGGKLMYAYINDQRYEPFELTSHNYGAGIFTRFRPIYQIYLHAEFDYAIYEDYTLYTPIIGEPYTESERNWVGASVLARASSPSQGRNRDRPAFFGGALNSGCSVRFISVTTRSATAPLLRISSWVSCIRSCPSSATGRAWLPDTG